MERRELCKLVRFTCLHHNQWLSRKIFLLREKTPTKKSEEGQRDGRGMGSKSTKVTNGVGEWEMETC